MSRLAFLDLAPALEELRPYLDAAYARVMDSGTLLFGDELDSFEQEFADYCGAEHCIGVGNGFDAIALSLTAVGVGFGDEVIVPGYTYIATWMAVSSIGAVPVPVDVLPGTFNLNPALVTGAITDRTKAMLPVHLYGQCADMLELEAIAKQHGIPLVADAAQSAGATLNGLNCGALGDAAAFSFYPTKNLGALGDSGAVVTNRADVAERLRLLRNYGSQEKNIHLCLGRNSRMEELQAAFLRVKLQCLDLWNQRRRTIAAAYLSRIPDRVIELPVVDPTAEHVWHLFTLKVGAGRDAFRESLSQAGIATGIYYPTPPHLSLAYADPAKIWSLPVTEALALSIVNLPLHPHLHDGQVETVCAAIEKAAELL